MAKKSGLMWFAGLAIVLIVAVNVIFLFKLMESNQANKNLSTERCELQAQNQQLQLKIEDMTTMKGGVAEHGNLTVRGSQLMDEQGAPVVLRGISSHGVAWYPEYTNYSALKTWKDYGANAFRIAMYVEQNDGYLEEPELNQKLLFAAIENSLAADLYTIVDWHVLQDENPNHNVKEAVALFEEVAKRYGDEPGIIYEICNEPNGDTTYNDIVKYAEQVIPAIRNHAPNALILVGTPKFCTSLSEAIADPMPYPNIMYTYHYYAGISDCEFAMEEIQRGIESGLPVFVSEWGLDTYEAEPHHWQETNEFLDFLDAKNISWINWSLSNKAEGYSLIRPDCDKLSGWSREDLSESGLLVLDRLSPENFKKTAFFV